VRTHGEALWRAATRRAQQAPQGSDALPSTDDRGLYWARISMALALRQWQPSFGLGTAERDSLIRSFEYASRGITSTRFAPGVRKILVTGFDPFTLDADIRIGNPSGANALTLDGQRWTINGRAYEIQAVVFPVRYTDFDENMVENSLAPHYRPGPETSAPIRRGDFLLIDLFAKEKAADSVYADITWCGVCAPSPTDRQEEIFRTVAAGRDAAVDLVTSRYPHTTVRGFEVDDAARGPIVAAGYGEQFIHRTGHSIGTSDHGQGANMDNLETHDTRPLLPMTGFSIEPGIYFAGDFGVRLEINVALTPERAEVTGAEPQRELLRL